MIRLFFAGLYFFLFIVSSFSAYANPVLFPLILGLTVQTFMGVGAMTEMMTDDLPNPQAAVGQSALAVTIKDPSTGSKGVRIPTTSSTDSSNAIPQPTAPSTIPPSAQYNTGSGGQYGYPQLASSALGACGIQGQIAEIVQRANLGNPTLAVWSHHRMVGENNYCDVFIEGSLYSSTYMEPYPASCPSGSILVNGACSITDARQSVPDGVRDYGRSGTTMSPKPDIDYFTEDGYGVKTTSATNDTVYANGRSSAGEPRVITVQALSTGGSQIKVATQKLDGGGRTYVENVVYDVNSSGKITSASSSTGAQTLALDSTGTALTPVNSPTSTFTPSSGGGTGPTAFPSDYARTGEAAAAAKTITDRLDSTTDVADPTLPQDQEFSDSFFKDTFSGMLAWQLPAHSSSCPVGSFSWNGQAYNVDAHCQLVNDHWGLLSQAMAVVWIIAALFVVMRA